MWFNCSAFITVPFFVLILCTLYLEWLCWILQRYNISWILHEFLITFTWTKQVDKTNLWQRLHVSHMMLDTCTLLSLVFVILRWKKKNHTVILLSTHVVEHMYLPLIHTFSGKFILFTGQMSWVMELKGTCYLHIITMILFILDTFDNFCSPINIFYTNQIQFTF